MSYPNLGAKFKSQYLLHMMPTWVGFYPLGQGESCAQLDQMDSEKKKMHMLLTPKQRVNVPKCPHVTLQL